MLPVYLVDRLYLSVALLVTDTAYLVGFRGAIENLLQLCDMIHDTIRYDMI